MIITASQICSSTDMWKCCRLCKIFITGAISDYAFILDAAMLFRNTSFGGPEWVYFTHTNTVTKDPWLLWRPLMSLLRLSGFLELDKWAVLARDYNVLIVLIRRVINISTNITYVMLSAFKCDSVHSEWSFGSRSSASWTNFHGVWRCNILHFSHDISKLQYAFK